MTEHEGLVLNLATGCKSDELVMNEQGLQIHGDLMQFFKHFCSVWVEFK